MTGSLHDRVGHDGIAPAGDALAHLSGDALTAVLRAFDWAEAPSPQALGRAMARRDVDLESALCVFFCGGPERFNYVPKPQVPAEYRAVVRQLDNVCLRINSGFYLPVPGGPLACQNALDRWLAYQRADRKEGRCGRWVLNETVLTPLFDAGPPHASPVPDREPGTPRLWRTVLAPLRRLRRACDPGRSDR